MAAPAYPCATGTDHRTLGPPAGHLRKRPVSLEMLFRSGPRNCVQSDPCAAGSREATPAAPTPIIQPRRVYIQKDLFSVEKYNTASISRKPKCPSEDGRLRSQAEHKKRWSALRLDPRSEEHTSELQPLRH